MVHKPDRSAGVVEYRDMVAAAAMEFFGVRKHKQFRLEGVVT